MLLKDKVAVITGSGQGIGKGIAFQFAKEGAKVVVVDMNYENAEEVRKEIEKMGTESITIKVDVSNEQQVIEMVKEVTEKFGTIDVLVNGAGIDIPVPVLEMTQDIWDKTMAVNARSVFLVSKEVGKIMIENKRGSIVNISSICAKTGEISNSVYCASKAAVSLFTDSLSKEWARYNIRVNAMCPATIDTPMIDDSFNKRAQKAGKDPKEFENELLDKVPLGRRGKPSEVGRLAVFLASDESSYITGQNINITGGLETH